MKRDKEQSSTLVSMLQFHCASVASFKLELIFELATLFVDGIIRKRPRDTSLRGFFALMLSRCFEREYGWDVKYQVTALEYYRSWWKSGLQYPWYCRLKRAESYLTVLQSTRCSTAVDSKGKRVISHCSAEYTLQHAATRCNSAETGCASIRLIF